MIKLYDSALSGNCHKVRMMLGFLGLPFEKVEMNWARGDHLSDGFRAVNPRAQLPALDDTGVVVWDSQAILVYLAKTYGSDSWLPSAPLAMARVVQWLMLANEEVRSLAWARVAVLMNRNHDQLPGLQASGRAGLAVLEHRLRNHDWVALDHVTIADVACFPYVGMAPQGNVSLESLPAVRAWIDRIKALPGYVPMPGLA